MDAHSKATTTPRHEKRRAKLRAFLFSPGKNPLVGLRDSVAWNLLLITSGSLIFSVGASGILATNNIITGGIYGTALLLFSKVGLLSIALWYLVLNVPLFIVGFLHVGRSFFLYSVYSVVVITLSTMFIHVDFGITEQIYAAVAGGIVCGTGSGMVLRSLGSGGGLDILAIILNRYFNIGIGKTFLAFNATLFLLAATLYTPDIVIASIIQVFIASQSLDYTLSLFNQRKIVYIISDHSQRIADLLRDNLHQGATFIKGQGAYSGQDKLILMTITNAIMLKKIENTVFQNDSGALFIVENSFNVMGSTFGRGRQF
ncbi:MAG: hypothetical protein CSA21_00215 [Deltaproteobacteria bacterium]|nr:MAG: hypothetical protein CSA21_00215 [Deltaproteobacteria bacterium]